MHDPEKIRGYKLGIIIPTNNPISFMRYTFASIGALAPMNVVGDVRLLLNFQPPWTATEADDVCRAIWLAHRIDSHKTFSDVTVPPMMFDLRGRAADFWPDADYYMIADDNMVYSATGTAKYTEPSWERYEQVIDYMTTFPNCGTVMCGASLGGSVQRYEIRPTRNGLISTVHGVFYRNIPGSKLYPELERQIIGGAEELTPAYRLLASGYFFAKQFNNPTQHKDREHSNVGKQEHNPNSCGNSKLLADNCGRYIQELYHDPTWKFDGMKTKRPTTLNKMYLDAGGDPDALACHPRYWKDYR